MSELLIEQNFEQVDALRSPEAVDAEFNAIVAGIDNAYESLPSDSKEQLDTTPTLLKDLGSGDSHWKPDAR